MPHGDPIYYHVHKILEVLGLDLEDYPDEETISQLEYILIHLLITEGLVARITKTVCADLNFILKPGGMEDRFSQIHFYRDFGSTGLKKVWNIQ